MRMTFKPLNKEAKNLKRHELKYRRRRRIRRLKCLFSSKTIILNNIHFTLCVSFVFIKSFSLQTFRLWKIFNLRNRKMKVSFWILG